MHRFLIPLFLLSLTGFCQSRSFTPDTAAAHALAHNPAIAAARYRIAEAQARLLQSGRRTNPELESEVAPNIRSREFSLSLGFIQKFPLTNRLSLEKSISKAELAAAQAEVKSAELDLTTAVRTLAVQLLSLDSSRALKQKQIANSDALAASAAKIAAGAEGSSLDSLQFELESQQLSLGLLQLDAERVTLTGQLRPLLGLPASETISFPGTLPEPRIPSSANPDMATRGDWQAAQARIEAARQTIALAKANRWEDAGFGLTAGLDRAEDAPDGLATDGTIGIRFSLPLPFWNKNEGHIQEAEATAARLEKEAESLTATIRADAPAALSEMQAARRLLDQITGTLLPKAAGIEEKITLFHQQAQPGILLTDVLRAREKRLAIEQARLDALQSFHLARIRLDKAMGR